MSSGVILSMCAFNQQCLVKYTPSKDLFISYSMIFAEKLYRQFFGVITYPIFASLFIYLLNLVFATCSGMPKIYIMDAFLRDLHHIGLGNPVFHRHLFQFLLPILLIFLLCCNAFSSDFCTFPIIVPFFSYEEWDFEFYIKIVLLYLI